MFTYETCEIFKDTYFEEHLRTTASEDLLTHFTRMFHFYPPGKREKTRGFMVFSWGIERRHWREMSQYSEITISECFTVFDFYKLSRNLK